MVTSEQMSNGILDYIESDILTHLDSWKKLGLATYISLATKNMAQTIDKLKDSAAISILGAVDENGMIDEEKLHKAICDNFERDIVIPIQSSAN